VSVMYALYASLTSSRLSGIASCMTAVTKDFAYALRAVHISQSGWGIGAASSPCRLGLELEVVPRD
jgi:hypothetical protein